MDNKAAATPTSQGAEKQEAQRPDLKEMVKKIVSKEHSLKSKEEKIEMAKMLLQIFEKGKPPYLALGITEEEIAAIYFFGFKIFNAGQYKESLEVFKILFNLKQSADYALSLGACYHKLKDYKNAASMYMMAIQFNPMDPLPFFYCYDCFVNMGNLHGASSALYNTILTAKQDKKYANIEKKASMLLKALNEQLQKEVEKNGEKK